MEQVNDKELELLNNGERDWSMFSEKQKSFLKAYDEVGGNISAACMKSGVMSRRSFYNWVKDDRFKEEIDAINESNIDYVESKLMTLISQDNPQAIMFFLKTKGKKRGYVETVENQLTINPFEELMKALPDDD